MRYNGLKFPDMVTTNSFCNWQEMWSVIDADSNFHARDSNASNNFFELCSEMGAESL